jgi:RNA polymerase sigma factor (sigma-70 family)
MTRTTNPGAEALLAHAAWLQRLAAHLVSDADREDIVQETWAAALRARPENPERLRPWLAQVMRNAFLHRLRERRRRQAREQEVSRLEETTAEPASAAMERLQVQRLLGEMVAALDEPFASTLVLRYFEGRSAAEIGRQMGVPAGTVRWRTKEALDRLRRQMDERHGGNRKAWVALLLPIARKRRWSPAPALGGAPWPLAAAGLLLLLVIAGVAAHRWSGVPAREQVPAEPGAAARAGSGRAFAGLAPVPLADAVVEGLVRTEQGAPVAGAQVAVRGPGPPVKMQFRSRRVRLAGTAISGSDGRFRIAGLPEGPSTVSATHGRLAAGYVRDLAVSAGAPARCEIVLRSARFALSGQVRDSGEGAIAGARVIALGDGSTSFLVVTDSVGRYRLPLADRVTEVEVEAPGYAPASSGMLIVDADTTRDFLLSPPARLLGKVLREPDRFPVEGAVVQLLATSWIGPERWDESVTTDAEGAFAIDDLPAGNFRVFARKGELVTPKLAAFDPGPGAVERLELTLEPGVAVEGRLTTPDGRGIADAGIYLLETGIPAAQSPLASADTDSGGRFQMDRLPPGRYRLNVSARGFAPRERTVEIPPASRFELALLADPDTLVTGVALAADGRPAAGAHLVAHTMPRGGDSGRMSFGRSGPDGRFELAHLGPGDLTVSASLGREAGFAGPVPLAAGEQKQVRLVLQKGAFVSGVVRLDDGTPAAGVRIFSVQRPLRGELFAFALTLPPVRTDGQGRFELGPFLDNEVNLVAETRNQRVTLGYRNTASERVVEVHAGRDTAGVELVVSSGQFRIAGQVLDPRGRPLGGATVVAVPEGEQDKRSPRGRQATSLGDGSFAIEGLGQLTHVLWASHPDFADVELRAVRAPGEGVRLRFPRPVHLSGSVVTPAGRPVSDYFLVAIPVPPAGPESKTQRSRREGSWDNPRLDVHDARGRFQVSKMAPGRYDLTASSPDGLLAQARDVVLAEGDSRRLRLVAEPGAVLVGRVVEAPAGVPLSGARVSTLLPGIRRNETLTDDSGAFRLTGVLPGPEVGVSVGGVQDVHRPERKVVAVPALGATVDLGTIELARLPGASADAR